MNVETFALITNFVQNSLDMAPRDQLHYHLHLCESVVEIRSYDASLRKQSLSTGTPLLMVVIFVDKIEQMDSIVEVAADVALLISLKTKQNCFEHVLRYFLCSVS